MNYTLMHRNIPVTDLEIHEDTATILRVDNLMNPAHLPLGVAIGHGTADRAALNAWWSDRSIPASRSGIREALEEMKIPNTRLLLTRCMGLSLSDQYWIKPQGESILWEDVNFFDHPFSEDVGDILIGKTIRRDDKAFSFLSPDNTSDGCLKKRWKIIDGKRCLLKAGSPPFQQQPFNEVIASAVMRRLGIDHVPYTLIWDDNRPYSMCEDFISRDTELVSAWRVMQIQKKDNSTSLHRHYLNCCEAMGCDITADVDRMIVLDYLIANEDRHQNNFGIVRDAHTLEWIGAAPIFDSGSSLGYDKLVFQIRSGADVGCKPFKKRHADQILLVSDYDWIEFDKLIGLDEEIYDVFSEAGDYVDETRQIAIVKSVEQRIRMLEGIAMEHRTVQDLTDGDVEEDIAEDYRSEPRM